MTRDEAVQFLRTFLDVRYRHQGRSREGMDCFGPVLVLADRLGHKYDLVQGYSRFGSAGGIRALLSQHAVEIPIWERKKCDVGVFWFDRHTKVDQHVGIFTGPSLLLHCYSDIGKVVEHTISPRWEKRLITVFAMPGLKD